MENSMNRTEETIPTRVSIGARQALTLSPAVFNDIKARASLYLAATGRRVPMDVMNNSLLTRIPQSAVTAWMEDMRATCVVRINPNREGFTGYVAVEVQIGNGPGVIVSAPYGLVRVLEPKQEEADISPMMFGNIYSVSGEDEKNLLVPTDPWAGTFNLSSPRIPSKGGGGASKKAA
jgi:hypothetical protein